MPVIPRSSSNVLILLNYLSFIVVSFFYTFFVFFRRKIDLVFIFCPSPILSAIPLILINKIFKKKVAIWVLDLWPDTIIDLKIIKNKLLISILKKIVKYIYNNCNLILAQSEAIKKEIESVTKTKCVYFPSWPEEKISEENLNFDEIKDKSNFGYLRIMFTGNIGEAQSFETMIKAASILKKK